MLLDERGPFVSISPPSFRVSTFSHCCMILYTNTNSNLSHLLLLPEMSSRFPAWKTLPLVTEPAQVSLSAGSLPASVAEPLTPSVHLGDVHCTPEQESNTDKET